MAKKRISFVLALQTGQFNTALTMAQKRLMRVSGQMKRIGSQMSRNITMPFVAIGAAGAKMTIDFDKNMTKIQTLVGATANEVNKFRQDVLQLSGQTAQAPAELADGLFFLTSAGLKGANAMQTLEAVSKGVAIGLGEQADLAKVAAAAQNAYGEDTLTAAQALDIFGGMVKTGMFEASELAQVLGTQLGLAANLGVSFEELGAMISTYTKTTGDANAATTGLSGVLMSFAKITPQQEEALGKIGMSVDQVREKLGTQGLQATLIEMAEAFQNNNVDLSEFFSKSQALKGVLGVLGNQTQTYREVLNDLHNSTGFVNDGFKTVSQTAGFKLEKSFNQLKLTAQEVGAMLIPIAVKAAKFIEKLVKAFTELDTGTKSIIVGLGAVAAAIGPLMSLGGMLAGVFSALLSPVGLTVAAIVAGATLIVKNWDLVKKVLVDTINYFINLYNESIGFRIIVETIAFTFKQLYAVIKYTFKAGWAIIKAFGQNVSNMFEGLGDVILGVFTLDYDKIKQGLSGIGKAITDTFDPSKNPELLQAQLEYGKSSAENFKTAFDNVMGKNPIEFISESDIDNVVNKATDMAKKIGDKIKGLFSPGGKAKQTATTESSALMGPPEPPKWMQDDTAISSFADDYKNAMEKIKEYTDVAFQYIGDIMNRHFANKATLIDQDYERQRLSIENSSLNEERKAKAIENLDKETANKRKQLARKQAEADKTFQIFQATINVAAQIAATLANPPLAASIAALGAAQIATIAATPLPALAEGGLAYGPTTALVGDNIGASSDPEVIAPLSKLSGLLSAQSTKNIIVEGVIKGEDIWLTNNRQNKIQNRIG